MAGDVGNPLADLGPQVERRPVLALLERPADQGHRQGAGQEAQGVDRDRRAVADRRREQARRRSGRGRSSGCRPSPGSRSPGPGAAGRRGWASPRYTPPGTSSGASPSAPRSAGSRRSSGRRARSRAGSARSGSPARSRLRGSSAAGRCGRRSRPANRPKTRSGIVFRTPTMPIAMPDPVRARTSRGRAVRLRASPKAEMPCPPSSSRKSRFWPRGSSRTPRTRRRRDGRLGHPIRTEEAPPVKRTRTRSAAVP